MREPMREVIKAIYQEEIDQVKAPPFPASKLMNKPGAGKAAPASKHAPLLKQAPVTKHAQTAEQTAARKKRWSLYSRAAVILILITCTAGALANRQPNALSRLIMEVNNKYAVNEKLLAGVQTLQQLYITACGQKPNGGVLW